MGNCFENEKDFRGIFLLCNVDYVKEEYLKKLKTDFHLLKICSQKIKGFILMKLI